MREEDLHQSFLKLTTYLLSNTTCPHILTKSQNLSKSQHFHSEITENSQKTHLIPPRAAQLSSI